MSIQVERTVGQQRFRRRVSMEGGVGGEFDVVWEPGFLGEDESRGYMEALLGGAQWHRPAMRLWGETRYTRRRVAWHADRGYVYRYSGQEHTWSPWTDEMLEIRGRVEERMGMVFQGVLLNLYEDGGEYVSPHSDDEGDLEPGSTIVSVSLGATRDCVFKLRGGAGKYVVPLASGDFLIMQGDTQKLSTHGIPKRAKVKEPRISLTFRRMAQSARRG